jgi:hypothetical protein
MDARIFAGKLMISESVPVLLQRASSYVITAEILNRLQESFASEILSIAYVRSQHVLDQQAAEVAAIGAGVGVGVGMATGMSASVSTASLASIGSSASQLFRGGQEGSGSVAGNSMGQLTTSHNNNTNSNNNSSNSSSNSSSNNSSQIRKTNSGLGAGAGAGAQGAALPLRLERNTSATSTASDATGEPAVIPLTPIERRKLLQKQQESDRELEAKILSGSEPPTFWLVRYGSKLPDNITHELKKIKADLMRLDEQVDSDKQQIQAKIIKACDVNRCVLFIHVWSLFFVLCFCGFLSYPLAWLFNVVDLLSNFSYPHCYITGRRKRSYRWPKPPCTPPARLWSRGASC